MRRVLPVIAMTTSHLPFPRKGTETHERRLSLPLHVTRHTYLFPARGRKPFAAFINYSLSLSCRSHLPFPRKGTETQAAIARQSCRRALPVTPTFSPQGDGNFVDRETLIKRTIVTPTFSPQGDENVFQGSLKTCHQFVTPTFSPQGDGNSITFNQCE